MRLSRTACGHAGWDDLATRAPKRFGPGAGSCRCRGAIRGIREDDSQTSGTDRVRGGRGFRDWWQARHAGTWRSSWVKQVNYNCTDLRGDFTDCSSALAAPRTRAEQLGGTHGEIIPPGVPRSFRAMLIRRSERSPPLGAIREIASRIRVIAVQPAGRRCRAGHRQAARHPAASPHDASTAGQRGSRQHPLSWCQMLYSRLRKIRAVRRIVVQLMVPGRRTRLALARGPGPRSLSLSSLPSEVISSA